MPDNSINYTCNYFNPLYAGPARMWDQLVLPGTGGVKGQKGIKGRDGAHGAPGPAVS